MWTKIKEKIKIWLSTLLFRFDLIKLNPADNDLIFVYYDKNMSYAKVTDLIKRLSDSLETKKYKIFFVSEEYKIDRMHIHSDDFIKIEVPTAKFYNWLKSDTLQQEGKDLKSAFLDQGINNKLIILPEGYTYGQEDLSILQKNAEAIDE